MSRRPVGGWPCEQTPEFKERKRLADKARNRTRGRPRYVHELYSEARRRGYSGSLEEYADWNECKRMRCNRADAWRSWLRVPRKAETPAEKYRRRYASDPTFMLWERHRNQFKKWLRGEKRTNTLARIVGYTREALRQHIEALFEPGMSWANYGEWHIDHRAPKNLFDPTNEVSQRECWALQNLRPLWASINCGRPKDGSDLLGSSDAPPLANGTACGVSARVSVAQATHTV